MAPADFFLFPKVKNALVGMHMYINDVKNMEDNRVDSQRFLRNAKTGDHEAPAPAIQPGYGTC